MAITQETLINFEHIEHKTIRNYIQEKRLSQRSDFNSLAPTCYKQGEKDTYLTHSKIFKVDSDLEKVWNTYLSISPRDTWKCETVSFGCMYCKSSQELTYINDEYDGLREGQILFLNVGLLWGLVNIAVAHQIVRIDRARKYIEFSYIEGGETEGTQRLTFTANKDGSTSITHLTTYRGKARSFLREKALYPLLHGRVIAAFHRNVKQKIVALSKLA